MDEFRLARGLAAEADVAAARLIVARVRNGGDLLIAVHGRDLNFNVIRPRHGGRAIARGKLNGAEVEAQPLDQALGLAEGAINEAVKYTKERVQFGRRLSQFQNTQFQLADMHTRTQAAQYLVYAAAMKKQNHEDYSMDAAMAKLFAAETASDVTRRAVQLFGGYGYTREYPVERMMRDAKITEIYEGTSEVQRMVVAKYLGVN